MGSTERRIWTFVVALAMVDGITYGITRSPWSLFACLGTWVLVLTIHVNERERRGEDTTG